MPDLTLGSTGYDNKGDGLMARTRGKKMREQDFRPAPRFIPEALAYCSGA